MWLVQRLEKKNFPTEGVKGVDGIVRFDYMGSSEFEWGALPKALKSMREVAEISTEKIVLQKLEHVVRRPSTKSGAQSKETCKAYFVGPASHAEQAKELFVSELTGENKKRLKEPTYIQYAYLGRDSFGTSVDDSHYSRYIGWWVIDGQPPWVLFKDEAVAREWMKLAYVRVPKEKPNVRL